MRVSCLGLVWVALLTPALLLAYGCASIPQDTFTDAAGSSSSSGSSGDSGSGVTVPPADDGGGSIIIRPDGSVINTADSAAPVQVSSALAIVQSPDCAGCVFPPIPGPATPMVSTTPPPCTSSAPTIELVYPADGVLIPPNMGLISVQWRPNGAPFTMYEIDFSSPPNTDWRIVTKCSPSYQTTDMQTSPAKPSGGCEFPIQGASWSFLSGANHGGNPVSITVRGTTDGICASSSANTIHLSFADEALLGTYYYWKSTVSPSGTGGQIWSKLFGAPNVPEVNITSNVNAGGTTLNATCNGCHALSRDGSRMLVYSDDNDSDDEYSDIGGSLLDLTTMPASEIGVGVTGARSGGQPPGFSTINPPATFYVTSNGLPLTTAGAAGGGRGGGTTSAGYSVAVPSNALSLWNGMGTVVGPVPLGAATVRPTMPDWSIDGKTIVYVQPQAVAQWDGTARNDDDHIFGGSLYTVPYTGNGTFGAASVFLQSNGENNYYPSYSPDATPSAPPSFIIFDRAPLDMSAGSLTACTTGSSPMCPNDSFSNPAARLMLIGATASGGTPIDLEKANGSPASQPLPLSNSYPRWAPFVQTYKGNKILWFTFSSTRDYGLRVLNHKTGMFQCYPADALETPGAAHGGGFGPLCQEPQLWMAPLTFSENSGTKDPSYPAFWIPYQDMTTHNHTAQWTEQAAPPMQPPPVGCQCSMANGPCGAANQCGCCGPTTNPVGPAGLVCLGTNICALPPS